MNAETLDQARLDVADKTRRNLFNWRGQFTPQFIEYILDVFAAPGQYILDPFCGSGTVLLEAAIKGLPAGGCEINPAAYAMAKFVALSNLSVSTRMEAFDHVEAVVSQLSGPYCSAPLFESHAEFRKSHKNLLEFAKDLFASMENKRELLLALIVVIRAEGCRSGAMIPALLKASASVRDDLLHLPYAESPINAELCDARMAHQRFLRTADLIVTSPPYINVFNYHQNYRAVLEVLGFDVLKVAESEIGSNRKNRGNRFRTVVQYALDMEQCLSSFAQALKQNGTLVLVVGHQSNVRGIPFSNSAILRELAISLDCFTPGGERHRIFTNRFGRPIREDIIVLRNKATQPTGGNARKIAETHLIRAFATAKGELQDDISIALNELPEIMPSPVFSRKGIV
jgi:DNA modification methylase